MLSKCSSGSVMYYDGRTKNLIASTSHRILRASNLIASSVSLDIRSYVLEEAFVTQH